MFTDEGLEGGVSGRAQDMGGVPNGVLAFADGLVLSTRVDVCRVGAGARITVVLGR